jgi:hypothetical protein
MTCEREGERPPERPNLRHLYLKRKQPGESYDAFVARLIAEISGKGPADEAGDDA